MTRQLIIDKPFDLDAILDGTQEFPMVSMEE